MFCKTSSDIRIYKTLFLLLVVYCTYNCALQDSNNLQCNQQGIVIDRNSRKVYDKFCCSNSNGHWEIGSHPNDKCCEGSNSPLYNGATHMCNGTDVIPFQTHLSQCESNKVCIRGSLEGHLPTLNNLPSFKPKNIADLPATSRMQPTADHEPTCNSIEETCCGGTILTEKFLCHRNMKIKKQHPSHDSVCGKSFLTYKKENQTCIGNSLHPGKKWCGNKKLVENSLCCFGKLFENAKGCCGAKGVKKDQICCGSNVFNIRKGYWCFRNQYVKKNVPVQSYFFKVQRKTRNKKKTCSYIGKMLVPSGTLALYEPRTTFSKFRIVTTPCKNLKKAKWYNILTTALLQKGDTQLDVSYGKSILKVPKKIDRHLTKYWNKII